jgi:tetratricopeptide (TPR) repeat protein
MPAGSRRCECCSLGPVRDSKQQIAQAFALFRGGDLAGAARALDVVIAAEPANVDALHILAGVKRAGGDRAGALALFDRALALAPDFAPLMLNRAIVLFELARFDEALAAFEAVLAREPARADVLRFRGGALQGLGRVEEALASYERALALRPGDAELLCDCGAALQALGRADEALARFDAALAAATGHAGAAHGRAVLIYNQGLPLLAAHDFAGFAEHEQRWAAGLISSQNHARGEQAWRGERLEGVLRVWPEQGVGDEIVHARFLSMALARTPRVALECDARLVPLFRRSFPGLESVSDVNAPAPIAGVAAQCSLASLGFALGARRADIEGAGAFVRADEARAASLRAKYGSQARGRAIVGVAWRSVNARFGPTKSSRLDEWGALLKRDDLFVSLQYGEVDAEIAEAARAFGCDFIADAEVDQMRDLDGFAAQIAALDHVVSVSNTTVHFAGALDKPCVVLLPADRRALWYWGAEGETTPWYASLALVPFDTDREAQVTRAAALLGA